MNKMTQLCSFIDIPFYKRQLKYRNRPMLIPSQLLNLSVGGPIKYRSHSAMFAKLEQGFGSNNCDSQCSPVVQ